MSDPLARRFEAIIFDWDGTAVADRGADASSLRRAVEGLCAYRIDLAVVSGTNADNVDGQLRARPGGPGRLFICANRGSEVFAVNGAGPRLVHRRASSLAEEAALDAATAMTVDRLRGRGLRVGVVSDRLNRRKVDLIPEPPWADPAKSRIDDLLAAVEDRLDRAGLSGLPAVVDVAHAAAVETGLTDARITSDAKYIEIGLTDKSDSVRWVLTQLWRRGIGAGLVLIAGDEMGPLGGLPGSDSLMLVPEADRAVAVSVGVEPEGVPARVMRRGGGPAAFHTLLEDQLQRWAAGGVPDVDEAPGWVLAIDGFDPAEERFHEALLTLADGRIGTSGTPPGAHPSTTPEVLAGGLYDGEGPDEELARCPVWSRLPLDVAAGLALRRRLDFRTGVLRQEVDTPAGSVRTMSFSSLAQPGHTALRAEGPIHLVLGGRSLIAPDGLRPDLGRSGKADWMRVRARDGGVAAATRERERQGSPARLDRFGVYRIDRSNAPDVGVAVRAVNAAHEAGFDAMLAAHRAAWASRWEDADVVIAGDPQLQRSVRFALFHLMASVPDEGEAALGARGLTGSAYRGHVFWDSDVFVLPFLAATHPQSARAMLEYRVRRLAPAKDAAAIEGREGARFPWESAGAGTEVTPMLAPDLAGRMRAIRTGLEEIHIVADVAWAAAHYLDWSADDSFGSAGGRELLVETARYWASRIRLDQQGRGHIDGVIGPDEYHESVDDNAYTNVMARWNLRRAAAAVEGEPTDPLFSEASRWRHLAESIVDGYDPATGRYEQFAGFYGLEPLVIKDMAIRRPVAADLLLGAERVAKTQVVKQADVLMLHHLVPDEVASGSLVPNLDYYEPRTAHGSSLSPGIHAALLARADRLDEALDHLQIAARIDLDDLTGVTATGLHLAAMGSVWQALASGFAGLSVHGGRLAIDPHIPPAWDSLELRLRFRGVRAWVQAEPDSFVVRSERPVDLRVGRLEVSAGGDDGTRCRRRGTTWEVTT